MIQKFEKVAIKFWTHFWHTLGMKLYYDDYPILSSKPYELVVQRLKNNKKGEKNVNKYVILILACLQHAKPSPK